MARIGYIGLGAMGGRVTKRLLDAGHDVVGYNRTRSKAEWLLECRHAVGRVAPSGRRVR